MSGSGAEPEPSSELRRRRDRLAEEVAQLHWNLGGLTYEMAIRDHFRLDVLMRRAAILQERDAELAEVERLLHMQESSIAGTCASCGAVRSRGAVFCWQCGAQVMERLGGSVGGDAEASAPEQDASTLVAPDVQEEIHRLAARPAQGPALAPQEPDTGDLEDAREHDTLDPVPVVPPAEDGALGRPLQMDP
jgi:hypothetical protein